MARKPKNAKGLLKSQVMMYCEPDQAAALKALSERTRIPQQVYLREGLDLVLAKHKAVRK